MTGIPLGLPSPHEVATAATEIARLRTELADRDVQVTSLRDDAKFLREQLNKALSDRDEAWTLQGDAEANLEISARALELVSHDRDQTANELAAAKAALKTSTETIKTLETAVAALRRVLIVKAPSSTTPAT